MGGWGRFNVDTMTRAQRAGFGLILMLMGVVQMGLAVFVGIEAVSLRANAAGLEKSVAGQCQPRLQALNFEIQAKDGGYIVRKKGLEDAAVILGEATAAALVCHPAYTLARLCMGEACEYSGGLELILKPVN